jgi:trinucleotide repeat-containing gene 6 protein
MEQFNASGRRLRLCGGGGDSLSGAGASGWGSPPSNPTANPNNPNAGNWGATAQQTPQQNWSAAQQAAGGGPPSNAQQQQAPPGQQQNAPVGQPSQAQGQKPLTPSGGGWANQPPQNPNQAPQPPQQQQQPGQAANPAGIVPGGTPGVAAKNQLEQLNSMREALFSQDGWGCQNVNQDSNWDVPGSPEPGPRGDPSGAAGATQWKSHTINNGTELWEANLRNGGQPPPQPVQKTPWNHTPSTNIGGTWGEEDDDSGENTSVWNNQNTQQPAPGWNQPNANSGAGATNVWPPAQGKFLECI